MFLARDVMTTELITAEPNATVQQIAELMLTKRISAVPIVGENDELLGIVSEADLIRRAELGTEVQRSHWLALFFDDRAGQARDFIQANAHRVTDVMTRRVVTATEDEPLSALATRMEEHKIKRLPIMRDKRLVGMVTRANLVAALVAVSKRVNTLIEDRDIRDRLLQRLDVEPWAHTTFLNVNVTDGVIDLSGMVASEIERRAIHVAAETIPGAHGVQDNIHVRPVFASGV
jgi:CBS domain-containing protein